METIRLVFPFYFHIVVTSETPSHVQQFKNLVFDQVYIEYSGLLYKNCVKGFSPL